MKAFSFLTLLTLTLGNGVVQAQQISEIRKMEAAGDVQGARALLTKELSSNPNNVTALTEYAEFLDRYGDPGAREAYAKLLAALRSSGNNARAGAVAHRLAILDLQAGDREA